MILLNFSLNLENNKGIYVLANKKSKNQHVMKYKTLECPPILVVLVQMLELDETRWQTSKVCKHS